MNSLFQFNMHIANSELLRYQNNLEYIMGPPEPECLKDLGFIGVYRKVLTGGFAKYLLNKTVKGCYNKTLKKRR